MREFLNSIQFSETTLPRQDYLARIFGYSVAVLTALAGMLEGYLPSSAYIVVAIALLYPHIAFFTSKQFSSKKGYITKQLLIHLDAVLCGLFLASMHFPIELSALYLVMINTSFIIVGSITAWAYCVISLVAGSLAGFLLVGYQEPLPVPSSVFVATAIGVGVHLAVTAFNSHRQARDLMRLKLKFQGQSGRFQALSQQASRYLAPQVWESIFQGRRQARLETHRKKLVVFFSDLVGFSALSEQMEAEALTDLLNEYLTDMSHIAMKYGGTIDKFIGDGVMIFFGDPTSNGTKRDAISCVSMAIEMRKHMLKLRQQWSEQGISVSLHIRMGISTGYCTVGNFGTENRMDYTIIGKEVNLASRLENEAAPGEILISQDTQALIKEHIHCLKHGSAQIKGFRDPVNMYQVIDYQRADNSSSEFINHESEGFALHLETDKVSSEECETVAATLERAATKLRQKKLTLLRSQPATGEVNGNSLPGKTHQNSGTG